MDYDARFMVLSVRTCLLLLYRMKGSKVESIAEGGIKYIKIDLT
jgi:hypothetical protein